MDRIKLTQKPSPYVLPTESSVELEEDQRSIRRALNPQNFIAKIYADDFASNNWLAKRLRRASTQRAKKQLPHALHETLIDLDAREPGEAAELVDRWSRGEPNARTEVRVILQGHGLGEDDIEGDAVCRCIPDLLPLDQLLGSAVSRRDKALAMFALAKQI